MLRPIRATAFIVLVFLFGLVVIQQAAAEDAKRVSLTVLVTEPHKPKQKETAFELKTGKRKQIHKNCYFEVDATQAYYTCSNPAFSLTLQENNTLLFNKRLYRIQSIKHQ